MFVNKNFLSLKESYLFTEVVARTESYKKKNVGKEIINLGVGDVKKALPKVIVEAIKNAVGEMGDEKTFRGYSPETGYNFLKEEIIKNEYMNFGFDLDEIFISDGIAADIGNILDLFDKNNVVGICDPVYPEYLDTNLMDGREIIFLDCVAENNFCPEVESVKKKLDLIYICNPNNPTGIGMNKDKVQRWIDYANENKSVLLYDGAYEKFISHGNLDDNKNNIPHSVYELNGAKECAIEFRSFSKSAGFTGLRCGYTVVPKNLVREKINLNKLWTRRQCTKTNGVSYIVQRGAQAVFSLAGKQACMENIRYYMENAKIIFNGLKNIGFKVFGGQDAPYVWFEIPEKYSCWEWFDFLLNNFGIVGTPGIGFGKNGERYFRFSAFGKREDVLLGVDRLKRYI